MLQLTLTDAGEIVMSMVGTEEMYVEISGYILLDKSLLFSRVTTCYPV
jgi:dolichyl-phosphate-mannose--protein O-mannosyl transferase